MTLFTSLRRWWINHQILSVAVRITAERNELGYLESCYQSDTYNQDLHDDILYCRAYIHALENQHYILTARLASL